MKLIAVSALCWAALAYSAGAVVSPIQTVLLTGTTPPGTTAESIIALGKATINNNGQMGVRTLSNPTSGGGPGGIQRVYVWQAGQFGLVARSGDSATNNAGAIFGAFGPVMVDDAGGVGVRIGTPNGIAGTGYLAYGKIGAGLRCVAQAQFTTPAPTDYPGGLGDLGEANLSPTGALGVSGGPQHARSMYSGVQSQSTTLRYAFNTQISGQPAGVSAGQLGFERIDGAGALVFQGTVSGSPAGLASGVLAAGPTGTRLVAGPSVPISSIPEATYTNARWPTVNRYGTIAVHADFARASPNGLSQGIFTITGNTSTLVAELGQTIPGMHPSITLSMISAPNITRSGRIMFLAHTQNSGTTPPTFTRNLIMTWDPSGLRRAFGVGDAVAGAAASATLEAIGSNVSDSFAFNDLGQAVFTGFLNQNGTFPQALVAYAPGEGLRAIATVGGTLEVRPGDVRTISALDMYSSSTSGPLVALTGDNGRGSSLNDFGQVVFLAFFTDGSSGLFTASIPAPSAAALMVVSASVCWMRRARRSRR